MRPFLLIAILLSGLVHMHYSSAQSTAATGMTGDEQSAQRASPDWNASVAIKHRVQLGEKHALNDLAGLDPIVAVPILSRYAKDRSTDVEAATIAQNALKRVRGLRDYFRPRIASLHAQLGGDFETVNEFETLSLIGTKEAVAATAPFLFDESESKNPELNSDVSVSSIRYQAVNALMKMKLSNAPTNKPFYEANDEDIKKWRAWWLTHKTEYEN